MAIHSVFALQLANWVNRSRNNSLGTICQADTSVFFVVARESEISILSSFLNATDEFLKVKFNDL